jgi:long-chain acyl-CoA synthetase
LSVHWPIIKSLLRHPRKVLVVDDNREYKGIELLVGAMYIADQIEARCKSHTLGIMLPSTGAFPMAALAGWMLGRTVVPLNFLLKKDELQFVIDDCETDTIISANQMLEFLGHTPRVKNLIKLDEIDFKKGGMPDLRWPSGAAAGDLAVLLYTSGTSGKPKGVMLSHGNLSANLDQIRRHVSFTKREVLLGVLPQFHTFGLTVLMLLPLSTGLKVVYSARFVPQKIVRLMRKERPTVFVGIPSMYNALMQVKDAGPEDLRSLRYTVSGGEPLPEAVFNNFRERFGISINEGYGLTETSPVTNWCRPEEWRPHSVGPALPEVDQRIVDVNTRREVRRGEEGEIIMAGPNIMQGYFKREEETRAVFEMRGGKKFLRTGDIGRHDEDGHLFITGRLKEMIIVGGENVFPREIEEVLNMHPAVSASGVIGQMDPVRGELPVAFVELVPDLAEHDKPAERDLVVWCRERLAGYKVPKTIRTIEALPRNPTGKIVRRDLRAFL